MRIPYVIDNQTHQLADVLNHLLEQTHVQAMDVATAYFTVRGYQQLASNLGKVGDFRLLLGAEPRDGEEIGMRPGDSRIRGLIRADLNREAFTPQTLQLVEDLIEFLSRDSVDVRLYHGEGGRRRFLHAKCYLLYGGRDGQLFEPRFNPLVGIVGSSNFTGPGLTTNQELNTVHKTLLEHDEVDDEEARSEVGYQAAEKGNERITLSNRRLIKSEAGARAIMDLRDWYQRQWDQAEDFKQTLIDLLWESKFGQYEYTPYEVYMKALYEYFKDDLGNSDGSEATRTAVELAEFQEDAVRKARQILRKGVFFYFTASNPSDDKQRQHFWRYYDLTTDRILDNRYLLADYIKCHPDTPRYVPADEADIFDIQERIIQDIIQSSQEQVAMESAPKQTDAVQQKIKVVLRGIVQNPAFDRQEVMALRRFVDQPMPNVHIRTLRAAYDAYSAGGEAVELVDEIKNVQQKMGEIEEPTMTGSNLIKRDDLYLICFDYIWS